MFICSSLVSSPYFASFQHQDSTRSTDTAMELTYKKLWPFLPLLLSMSDGFTINNSGTHLSRPSQQCGEIRDGDFGNIHYKEENSLLPYERCVWVLRSWNYNRINVRVDRDIIGNSTVYVSTFTRNEYRVLPMVTNRRIDGPSGTLSLPGSLAVITIVNNDTIDAGSMAVSYSFHGDLPANISYRSRDFLSVGDQHGEISHPDTGNPWSRFQLSTFLVHPNPTLPSPSDPVPVINYNLIVRGTSTYDRLNVYVLTMEHGWRFSGTYTERGEYQVRSTEMVLFVMTSENNYNDGFSVNW